ncbi:MAG TPA: MBL fold metallo-hydrolase [Xanthomonadales bacterium]|nr:MBL fold metallo-hydrolase [Xanthomonadales bacterium]
MGPSVHPFFHAATGTWSYVATDPATRHAVVIDPVLEFDVKSGRTGTALADAILAHVRAGKLVVDWVLETHAHADHLSAGPWLANELGAPLAIGAGITAVQAHAMQLFAFEPGFVADGRQFDRLLRDGERLPFGSLAIDVLATPGHTPDGVSYRIGDAVFVGDTLFAPDVGTARCDFPGGSAARLYESIGRLLALPPATRLFLCHDYPPAGREPRAQVSVAEQRDANIHVANRTPESYVALREGRDATLPVPQLLLPAVQYNVRGRLGAPRDAEGRAFLRLPLDAI